MPKRHQKHKEYYEVSKEEVKYMRSSTNTNTNTNTSSNNKNMLKNDQCTLERDHNTSATFNYEYRVDGDTCKTVPVTTASTTSTASTAAASAIESVNCVKLKTTSQTLGTSNHHTYENLKFDINLSKKYLLHKFFHNNNSETGANTYAIYENLCRGCNYGVFEAHGHLCNFCQCIVNGGVYSASSYNTLDEDRNTHATSPSLSPSTNDDSANIYENICDKCNAIYSSVECSNCSAKETNDEALKVKVNRTDSVTATSVKSEKSDAKSKLRKSKSSADSKRSIFHGLIGSLRRVKTPTTASAPTPSHSAESNKCAISISPCFPRKPLEIIHNIDGYENVFRTQETFDLQRICELKRKQLKPLSSSDHHIYGRLNLSKSTATSTPTIASASSCSITQTLPHLQTQSHDELLKPCTSADDGLSEIASETINEKLKKYSKRPRISKPRLLRPSSSAKSQKQNNTYPPPFSPHIIPPAKQSLYLPDSVCSWMTSLRREIHNYRSYSLPIDDDKLGLCNPKSIPAKNTLSYRRTNSSSGVSIIGHIGAIQNVPFALAPTSHTSTSIPVNLVTNFFNIDKSVVTQKEEKVSSNYHCDGYNSNSNNNNDDDGDDDSSNCDSETVTLRCQLPKNSSEFISTRIKPNINSPVAQMVHDFKQQLMAKQMQQRQKEYDNEFSMSGTNTSTSTEMRPELESSAAAAQIRSKRQAIYLSNNEQNNNNGSTSNNNNNSNNDVANINYIQTAPQLRKQTNNNLTGPETTIPTTTAFSQPQPNRQQLLSAVGTSDSSEQGLLSLTNDSRRVERQPFTTTSKRCGIYERDSEFVNDILSAFEVFLQRETESNETYVVADNESQDKNITAEVISNNDQRSECAGDRAISSSESAADIAYQCSEENCVTAIPKVIDEQNAAADNKQGITDLSEDRQTNVFGATTTTVTLISEADVKSNNTLLVQLMPLKNFDIAVTARSSSSATFVAAAAPVQIFDVAQLINNLLLSLSLNKVVIYYDNDLKEFLHYIYQRSSKRARFSQLSHDRLLRKYRRYRAFECRSALETTDRQGLGYRAVKGENVDDDHNCHQSCAISNESVALHAAAFSTPKNGSVDACVNSVKIIVKLVDTVSLSEEVYKVSAAAVAADGDNEHVAIVAKENMKENSCVFNDNDNGNGNDRVECVNKVKSEDNEQHKCLKASKATAIATTTSALEHKANQFMKSVKEKSKESQVAAEISKSQATSVTCSSELEPATDTKNKPPTKAALSSTKKTSPAGGSPKHIKRPQVPARDPKTTLTTTTTKTTPNNTNNNNSPPLPAKRESPHSKMTVPTANTNSATTAPNNNNNLSPPTKKNSKVDNEKNNKNNSIDDDDGIYQPIWKFKTVGEVQERYQTDADYYEVNSITSTKKKQIFNADGDDDDDGDYDDSSLLPSILISNEAVADHGEWETDDEFMFTTQIEKSAAATEADNKIATDTCSLNSSTMRSTRSNNSSITGSTVTGFGSSTVTLASAASASLQHHLLRNIGIFFSLNEPKLRAVIYDYDRVYASVYFAKRMPSPPSSYYDGGGGISVPTKERSPMPPPRTSSAVKSSPSSASTKSSSSSSESVDGGRLATAAATPKVVSIPKRPPPPPPAPAPATSPSPAPAPSSSKLQLLPDSVQAWKFMLLDVNYLEDEEDMIVSENEILRAQEIKDEDIDTHQTQQLNILQRFKSASFGNLIDLPNEDDKKSIAERMRNKLQRGVFKLNVRSPKSEKKSRGIFRRTEATSLYLEDGMKPKYPIFGAPLEQLELNMTTHPQVPRFVVDCVEYIERKDCIFQDGLYRASGNKVCIDELKKKLSESYIYDPKLLVCDDIHTLTGLLKSFFRELGAPLIPQETYERLGSNHTDPAAIVEMSKVFEDMCEPNRSTLKFVIKHLTNVAACCSENRMTASNLAIVWGPSLLSSSQIEFDIGRVNTLAKVLIENYKSIFKENERLVS